MNLKQKALLAVMVSGLSGAVVAAPAVNIDMEPGLWENRFTVEAEGAIGAALKGAQKYLASLPEAERKMMETMMEQQGVSISNDGQVVKVCMTEAQIRSGQLPQTDTNCDQQLSEIGKNKFRLTFSCGESSGNAKGTGEIHFQDRKNYTGEANFTTRLAGGNDEVVNVVQRGKWLSADCGTLAPAP